MYVCVCEERRELPRAGLERGGTASSGLLSHAAFHLCLFSPFLSLSLVPSLSACNTAVYLDHLMQHSPLECSKAFNCEMCLGKHAKTNLRQHVLAHAKMFGVSVTFLFSFSFNLITFGVLSFFFFFFSLYLSLLPLGVPSVKNPK